MLRPYMANAEVNAVYRYQPCPLLKAKFPSMACGLRSHSMRVRSSLPLVLATTQYCVPLLTIRRSLSLTVSTVQQVPNLGALDTIQLRMTFPGIWPPLSAVRLSTKELGDPVLCSTATEI